jgi:AraC-like DNA-binding protein
MDPLSELLQGIHAHGSVLHRTVLEPPWSLRIAESAQLTLATVLQGELWVVCDDGETTRIVPGEIGLFHTAEHYTVADDPTTPVQVVVTPSGAHLVDGTPLPPPPDSVTCTLDDGGTTVVISGNYTVAGDLSQRLLAPLPRLAKVRAPQRSALLDLLADELTRPGPGQQAALDRWLDLALVSTLRAWFARDGSAPGWYVALTDPVAGPALRAMHADPARGWTVAALAQAGNASRTSFAARFTELVGESPISYLTGLRLDLAAARLRDSTRTLESIAREVGYSTPFALSTALKRRTGRRPADLRARAAG